MTSEGAVGSTDGLIEKRWKRYGHDRVYLSTAGEVQVGYVDLKTAAVVVSDPSYESALSECRDRWCVSSATPEPSRPAEPSLDLRPSDATPTPAPALPVAAAPRPTPLLPVDLAKNYGGAAARTKRNELLAQAPVRNRIARLTGVRTPDASWRDGAKGEHKVAVELAKLDDRWHRMHAVPIGDRGADIDHVVIGPPGVFTLNAKRHKDGTATVYEKTIYVNGEKVQYLRNSRYEAGRASNLMSAACGFEIAVTPMIVFVDLAEFTVKQQPPDVHVINRRALVDWLLSLPTVLDPRAVEVIWANARVGARPGNHRQRDRDGRMGRARVAHRRGRPPIDRRGDRYRAGAAGGGVR